jgi:hypothetical protein
MGGGAVSNFDQKFRHIQQTVAAGDEDDAVVRCLASLVIAKHMLFACVLIVFSTMPQGIGRSFFRLASISNELIVLYASHNKTEIY